MPNDGIASSGAASAPSAATAAPVIQQPSGPAPGAARVRFSDMGSAAPQAGQDAPTGWAKLEQHLAEPQQMANLALLDEQAPVPTNVEVKPDVLDPQVQGLENADVLSADQLRSLPIEQLGQQAQQWLDSESVPEAFGNKVIWVNDVPIELQHIKDNVMLYSDYQRKTSALAQDRREFTAKIEKREQGVTNFINDIKSGDTKLGMRALRAVGVDKTTFHNLVVEYVRNQAALEAMHPDARQAHLEAVARADAAELDARAMRQQFEESQRTQQTELTNQGVDAPDIKHVVTSLDQRLPGIERELGVIQSPAYERELAAVLVAACTGTRDAAGQWVEPPVIQPGRPPSNQQLRRLIATAKENVALLVAQHRAPPQVRPPTLAGAGPAAAPGQRGNLSAPARGRFSDM